MALQGVKARLAKIQEDIDEADSRAVNANHEIREAQTRLEKAEGELGTHIRRQKLLEGELETYQDRYKEAADKLEKVLSESEGIETKRRELEESEAHGDERLQDLEEQVKEVNICICITLNRAENSSAMLSGFYCQLKWLCTISIIDP